MKRIWSLIVLFMLILAFGNVVFAQADEPAAIDGALAPRAITPSPMPPQLTPVPLFAPLMGSIPPAACLSVDTPEMTLSPLRATAVEVVVNTQNASYVEIGENRVSVDANGVAHVTLLARPHEVYSVQIDGRDAPNCDFSFAETPSQWVGVHGDPYAWVGEHGWLEQNGLIHLFTAPTTELVVSRDLLTEVTDNNGRWTYVLHYAGPGMEMYAGLLRPGNQNFQHFFRVTLVTPDGQILRVRNLGHIVSPETLGELTVDSGPGTEAFVWRENGVVEFDDFTVEFKVTSTHNGIHQAALVSVPGDNSQWIFTRELNGGGAFISARIDGRIIADDVDGVGGVFGRLLRDEDPTLDAWVVGVIDGDMPGPYQASESTEDVDGTEAFQTEANVNETDDPVEFDANAPVVTSLE